MSDHRWQGYSHSELFAQIHDGPGPQASGASVQRWAELSRALGQVDTDLATALSTALAGWRGTAAESARDSLHPLGEWAQQARDSAQRMRERTEQQADFIAKARADMPPPIPVTSEEPSTATSLLVHLFGGQTDYEQQEARQNAAEERAFEVMRTYQASSEANTTSLASFSPPPKLVVDAPAGTPATGSPGQQHVTITWGGTAAHPAGPGNTARSGSATAGGERSGRAATSPDTSRAGSSGGRSARRHDRAEDDEHAERIEPAVTEEIGEQGGFFDEPRTLTRPVIGEP
ncbi:hypothetical protein FHX42_004268 [Saccharopolyspora lacisalsi]|uniref:PPE domain-containing protein n=1 Tax=Halosaccharopolyspora lacisalsi TaxID=1000566 RepID=A0A839E1X2_9PSEU|nr:PPE domain-containing protein [Halosaccharopolyspora lacisalsi]MBA8826889.1 hypothetical protein [Halosaccharopolyspora lacisalsi]